MSARDPDEKAVVDAENRLRDVIAARVDEFRRRAQMSVRYLADAAQLTPAAVSQVIAAKNNVTINTLVKLAYALDVGVLELLSGVVAEKPRRLKVGRPRVRRLAPVRKK